MMYVSFIANGYYQQGVTILTTVYANPTFLKEGTEENADLLSNVDKLRSGFLEWRKSYDKQVAENEPTDEDMTNEETVEEMLEQSGT